jgi:molecular chaperone Hsp33
LLGEAVALTALLGAALKIDGQFQLQARTTGAVELLVVDYDLPENIRAYARYDEAAVAAAPDASPADLLGHGHLGLTIEQGAHNARYQGIVALSGQGLEESAHQYFTQSEQIPTRVRLAVGQVIEGGKDVWRAGGIVVQFLPSSPEKRRHADLHPGDAPAGADILTQHEDDDWLEARALVETVEDHELVDPLLSSEELLYRLFHERGVRVFESQPLLDRCRCSRERIVGMIERFSEDERRHMIADDGAITVTCEFCSTHYHVEPTEVGVG